MNMPCDKLNYVPTYNQILVQNSYLQEALDTPSTH